MMVRRRNFPSLPGRRSFLRFFLPLVPSKVEQFMMSRNIAVTVSIHERRVLGGKLNSQRDLRAHKNGRGRSRLS